MSIYILGIETSCDDTSAAVVKDGIVLSNEIATQDAHKKYGGVIPELASREHEKNIIPVIDYALKNAGINKKQLSAVAFTRGPGLLGSLLVGTSFAKAFALSLGIPLIEVNHLQAHVLANFAQEKDHELPHPSFPFLSLLVSGGHTQLIVVKDYLEMKVIGNTIDDAAGEAFDKCAKVMGLPYPGGPMIDKYAKEGNEKAFAFTKPRIANFDFSFSGLKTAFLYFLRDEIKKDANFIDNNKQDICASIQFCIVDILIEKLIAASEKTGIRKIALAGGVSANSRLQQALKIAGKERGWDIFIPGLKYTMDNAGMIAITGYYKYLQQIFAPQDIEPLARYSLNYKGK